MSDPKTQKNELPTQTGKPEKAARAARDCAPDGACPKSAENPRLGKVGGEAVLEGVMMKAGEHVVTTCRKENGSLVVTERKFSSVRKKNKLLNLPLLRGVISFIETMILSIHTLEESAAALGIEDEEETRFEKWLKKRFGIGIVKIVMVLGTLLGLLLAIGLFIFLPRFLVNTVLDMWILGGNRIGLFGAVIEGVIKIGIFLAYLSLISLMPDIKRTFMYHGAEHKSIACFEAGEELTPENAMKCRRFHPRCGTSFMFFMILLGILAGLFVRVLFPTINNDWAYTGIRLLLLPLVVGLGYEFIMYAGRHENLLTKILSAPGLWVQRLTTKEPTADMLECAITSLKCALRDDFPEFRSFYDKKPWIPVPPESDLPFAEESAAQEEKVGDFPENSADLSDKLEREDQNEPVFQSPVENDEQKEPPVFADAEGSAPRGNLS